MAERYRVLISCPRAWDGLDQYTPLFEEHGVEVDVPQEVRQQLTEAELLPLIAYYDGILAGDDQLTRSVINAGVKLKVISKWGVGVDSIDLEAASDAGVAVLNTPGMFGDEMAEYTLGFLILMARRQHEVDRAVRGGQWPSLRGHTLAGRTLGIVGLGHSGSALASRAMALRMRVMGTDPWAGRDQVPQGVELVDLDGLLRESDVVSLHLPGQPDGAPAIGEREFELMKAGSWLINTSRGSLVDEQALIAALDSGKLAAAALDVFETEPIDPDHPLLDHPSVILGSHNGSNTHEAVERTTRAAVENLISGLRAAATP